MKEKATLYEVKEDGGVLVLLDGKRLYIYDDITTTCLWLPTAELEIEESGDRLLPLLVHNLDTGEVAKARSKKIDKATAKRLRNQLMEHMKQFLPPNKDQK